MLPTDGLDKLVRMANQIATYFRSYPDEEAMAGVREHIVAFWTPRMVETLRLRSAEGECGLMPLAAAALRGPQTARSPAEKSIEDAGALGQLASDAG